MNENKINMDIMKSLGGFSIATQLKYGLPLIVGLGIFVIGSVLIALSFNAQLELLYDIQRKRSKAVAQEINAYIADLQRKLGYLAQVRGLAVLPTEVQHNFLEGLTRHNSAYKAVAIMDRNGNLTTTVASYKILPWKDSTISHAFYRAVKEQEDFFGFVEFDPISKLPFIIIAVPIRDQLDQVAGALLAKINLEFLWFVVDTTEIGLTGYSYIVDERRFLIVQEGSTTANFKLRSLSDYSFIQQIITAPTAPVMTYQGLRGMKVIGSGALIESVNWHVVVELPVAEAYAPIYRKLMFMGVALLLATIPSIGIGIFFSRRIVLPLQRLREASTQISLGNLAVEVDIGSNNELSALAKAFNRMTSQLRELIHGMSQKVAELEKAEETVRNYAENLEEMVAERTKEIQAQAEKLQKSQDTLTYLIQDVNLSRFELQKSNRDLEKEISERQLKEKQIEQYARQLEGMNQELKDFAYIVSHDLKAPLRAVAQLAHWLSEDYGKILGEEGKELTELMVARISRMYALIEGILTYSRIGRVKEKKDKVSLSVLVTQVIDVLNPPEHIEISIKTELPVVMADATQMEQVFQNLLNNAIKYMDKPRGYINIHCYDEENQWEFSVTDNGPGIDNKYHEKVFQIFQTLAPKDEQESTGIGLTLVKKIVELYGGTVWFDSEPGKGTTFFFILPKKGQDHE